MAKHSRDDIDKFHDYGIYIPARTIYVGSEEYDMDKGESGVDGFMAERLIKNLTILEKIAEAPITIQMNNPGGDIYHGLAIYDAIKACKSHVTIVIYGHAMSAGSIILQAADERIMAPNAKQMIHYGTAASDNHAKTFQRWAKEYAKIDEWMENMYWARIKEKHPEYSHAKVKHMLDHDTFLTPSESISFGLADKVLGQDPE